MVKIGDYAKDAGVSYEAVRQQIKKYEKELAGHIIIDNRTKYLDDEAVLFLNSHRNTKAVVIEEGVSKDRVEELEAQVQSLQALNANLLAENNMALKETSSLKDKIIELGNEKQLYLEDKNKLLLEQDKNRELEAKQAELENKNKELEEAISKLNESNKELQAYKDSHRSIFDKMREKREAKKKAKESNNEIGK